MLLFFYISESYQSYTFLVYPGQYIRQSAGETNLAFLIFTEKKTKDVLSTGTFQSTPPYLHSGFSYTLFLPPLGAQAPLLPAAEWSCCWRPAFTFSSLSAEETLLTISHTLIKARIQRLLHTHIQIGILATCLKKTLTLQWILVGYLTLNFVEHLNQGNGTSTLGY